ncbi:MAG: hypothetical protein ABI876_08070 [Bacteroidota bacterium]
MEKKEKKDIFYQMHYLREENILKHLFWGVLGIFATPCQMLIEAFLRKDFGERYFRLSAAINYSIILALWPYIWQAFSPTRLFLLHTEPIYWPGYITWYIYLVLFLAVSFRHHQTMKRTPGVYDFARFSHSRGRIHAAFFKINVFGHPPAVRTVECWLEPALAFFAGFLLLYLYQYLGLLLMFSAVVYSISYCAAYNRGDSFVMDKIDEMIINEEQAKTFLYDADESETRGYTFIGRKPSDPAKRRAVLEQMMKGDDEVPMAR